MSLSQVLTKNIETVIESYIDKVAEKYNLIKGDLLELWSSSKKITRIDMDDLSIERLHKCNKTELVALCKSKGYRCMGTKDVLINRLLRKEEEPAEKNSTSKTTSKIADRLAANIPVIPIRRNDYGNLVHPETELVFDRKTETVIGKQKDNGTISDLTKGDIELCKRFKFKYIIPDNLDRKGDIKIKELENDSDIEIVEDSEEEEEEY